MKRGIQTLILLSFLFGLSNCKKEATDVVYSKSYIKEIKAARQDIIFFLASNFIPGASVTVIKDGKIIYSDAFGLSSQDLGVPAKRETKFRIGDLSQIFTNLIYQKLVEEGTLHPDSSIQHYFPEFPKKEHKLVLSNLAQHTSSIREMNPNEKTELYLNYSIEKGLDMIKEDPLLTPPGLYQVESHFNYNLLGLVMEKATKKRFHKLLKEYVTDTLHLNNTVVDNPLITIKNRSNFYDHNYIAQIINATTLDLRFRAPSDGMLSTSEDLAKMGLAVIDSDFLSPKTKEKLFEPILLYNDIPSSTSNAWFLRKDNARRKVYGKSGTVTGGGSVLLVYPSENLIVAYACNLTVSMENTPVLKIANHFLPATEEKKEETNNDE